jgi:hypothetical protein
VLRFDLGFCGDEDQFRLLRGPPGSRRPGRPR